MAKPAFSSPLRMTEAPSTPQPGLREYALVSTALALFGVGLHAITDVAPSPTTRSEALLGPIFALVALIGVVWLLMGGFRNFAILRGIARVSYYARYGQQDTPPDWVERPARTFNNLMQVPTLFVLVCVLMMVTREVDTAQVLLAWAFVATRVLHAIVYIAWNYVPARFGLWTAGVIALAVIWSRFALQTWHLISV